MNRQIARARTFLTGIVIALLLAGCGSQQPAAPGGAAGQLQERVRTVRQLVTEQNHSAALAELDGLSADVSAAAARGDLSAEQQQRAEQALGAVRTDLESMASEAVPADAPVTDSPTAPDVPSSDTGSSGNQEPDGEDCDDDGGSDQQAWHGHDGQDDQQDPADSDEDDD